MGRAQKPVGVLSTDESSNPSDIKNSENAMLMALSIVM